VLNPEDRPFHNLFINFLCIYIKPKNGLGLQCLLTCPWLMGECISGAFITPPPPPHTHTHTRARARTRTPCLQPSISSDTNQILLYATVAYLMQFGQQLKGAQEEDKKFDRCL
jgi:hypothetical protein